jgi:hypothetical protein
MKDAIKWILKKYDMRVWTELIWFMVETSGGHMRIR